MTAKSKKIRWVLGNFRYLIGIFWRKYGAYKRSWIRFSGWNWKFSCQHVASHASCKEANTATNSRKTFICILQITFRGGFYFQKCWFFNDVQKCLFYISVFFAVSRSLVLPTSHFQLLSARSSKQFGIGTLLLDLAFYWWPSKSSLFIGLWGLLFDGPNSLFAWVLLRKTSKKTAWRGNHLYSFSTAPYGGFFDLKRPHFPRLNDLKEPQKTCFVTL